MGAERRETLRCWHLRDREGQDPFNRNRSNADSREGEDVRQVGCTLDYSESTCRQLRH